MFSCSSKSIQIDQNSLNFSNFETYMYIRPQIDEITCLSHHNLHKNLMNLMHQFLNRLYSTGYKCIWSKFYKIEWISYCKDISMKYKTKHVSQWNIKLNMSFTTMYIIFLSLFAKHMCFYKYTEIGHLSLLLKKNP